MSRTTEDESARDANTSLICRIARRSKKTDSGTGRWKGSENVFRFTWREISRTRCTAFSQKEEEENELGNRFATLIKLAKAFKLPSKCFPCKRFNAKQ